MTEYLCCRNPSPTIQVAYREKRLRSLKYTLDDAPMPFRQYALPSFELLDQLDLLTSPE
jgi:hypothetical protein